MSDKLGSPRHERDLAAEAAGGAKVYTRPWWDAPGEESRSFEVTLSFDGQEMVFAPVPQTQWSLANGEAILPK